ncbi:MAG: hypothetical protein XD63_0444 [Thermoanaerobacterales bacterium 50_218]|nr:MAG: hypothetical protein XD63_0444 [Thermoanaerobacterales bacterium 50_218]
MELGMCEKLTGREPNAGVSLVVGGLRSGFGVVPFNQT